MPARQAGALTKSHYTSEPSVRDFFENEFMRHSKKSGPAEAKAAPAPEQFIRLARLSADSSNRFEDRLFDNALQGICHAEFAAGTDSDIELALSELKNPDLMPVYEELLSMAEECAQSRSDETGAHLLVLIPVLCWSRYVICSGKVEKEALKAVAESYRKHFAGAKAEVRIGAQLLAPENIPDRLIRVRALLDTIAGESRDGVADISGFAGEKPSEDFSTARYLALVVSAENEDGLLRGPDRSYQDYARACMEFCLSVHSALEDKFVGSVFAVQPPAAFYNAWRQTENAMRVYSLRAMVDFVGCMGIFPESLIATSALFEKVSDPEAENAHEVRIGVSRKDRPHEVMAGVILPCTREDADYTQEIAAQVLAFCGVRNILNLEQIFPMEYCEDCGAPLYASPQGMTVHLTVPEDVDAENFAPTLN